MKYEAGVSWFKTSSLNQMGWSIPADEDTRFDANGQAYVKASKFTLFESGNISRYEHKGIYLDKSLISTLEVTYENTRYYRMPS